MRGPLRWWRQRWQRPRAGHNEVLDRLAQLDNLDSQVIEMGRKLQDRQAANNFSGMVAAAIHRATIRDGQ